MSFHVPFEFLRALIIFLYEASKQFCVALSHLNELKFEVDYNFASVLNPQSTSGSGQHVNIVSPIQTTLASSELSLCSPKDS